MIVYKQTTIKIVVNEVNPILSPVPICVKIYFTPEKAAVYTEGIKMKYNS